MFRKLDRIKALPGGQLSRLNTELLQLVVTKTHPGRLRAGSQRERWCFPLHFRHFPLDYLLGAWYNKVVIPQTIHQQHSESA